MNDDKLVPRFIPFESVRQFAPQRLLVDKSFLLRLCSEILSLVSVVQKRLESDFQPALAGFVF